MNLRCSAEPPLCDQKCCSLVAERVDFLHHFPLLFLQRLLHRLVFFLYTPLLRSSPLSLLFSPCVFPISIWILDHAFSSCQQSFASLSLQLQIYKSHYTICLYQDNPSPLKLNRSQPEPIISLPMPTLLYSPNLLYLDWIHYQDDSPTWLTGWRWLSAGCLPRAFDQGASVPLYSGFFTVQCGSWVPTVFQETGSGICRSLKAWA